MRALFMLCGVVLVLSGCGRKSAPVRTTPAPSSSVETGAASPASAAHATRGPARGPRHLNGVPPGHYPKRGQCRVWVPGRPPGQQAAPTSCASLRGRVPAGAFVLYGDRAWDADFDWAAQSRRERGSVPQAILDVFLARR
jgi:hypothetical protein